MSNRHIIFVNRVEFTNDLALPDKACTYLTLSIGNKTATTSVAKDCGKYPFWEQYFEINLPGKEKNLIIEVFESKKRGNRTLLGVGSFNLLSVQGERNKGLWIELFNEGTFIGHFIMGVQINPKVLPQGLIPFQEPAAAKVTFGSFFSQNTSKKEPVPVEQLQDCTRCTREHIERAQALARSKGLSRKGRLCSVIKKICTLSYCLSPLYFFQAKPIEEIVNPEDSDDEEEIAALMDKNFEAEDARIEVD
mgnify:FL=1